MLTLPRGRPCRRIGYVVDYRHIIHSLRRKPMALFNLVYREQLFPREVYRRTREALIAAMPARNACRTMVGLLALAHDRACEAVLASELEAALAGGELPDLALLQQRFTPSSIAVPEVTVSVPAAVAYDARLSAAFRSRSLRVLRAVRLLWPASLPAPRGASRAELSRGVSRSCSLGMVGSAAEL